MPVEFRVLKFLNLRFYFLGISLIQIYFSFVMCAAVSRLLFVGDWYFL